MSDKFISKGNTFVFIPKPEAMTKEFFDRLNTETVYLWDDESQTLIKSLPPPNGKCMAKIPPNGQEFQIPSDSHPVVRALAAAVEVTKEQYDKNIDPTTDKAISR